jgi:hypothetical protein
LVLDLAIRQPSGLKPGNDRQETLLVAVRVVQRSYPLQPWAKQQVLKKQRAICLWLRPILPVLASGRGKSA